MIDAGPDWKGCAWILAENGFQQTTDTAATLDWGPLGHMVVLVEVVAVAAAAAAAEATVGQPRSEEVVLTG